MINNKKYSFNFIKKFLQLRIKHKKKKRIGLRIKGESYEQTKIGSQSIISMNGFNSNLIGRMNIALSTKNTNKKDDIQKFLEKKRGESNQNQNKRKRSQRVVNKNRKTKSVIPPKVWLKKKRTKHNELGTLEKVKSFRLGSLSNDIKSK